MKLLGLCNSSTYENTKSRHYKCRQAVEPTPDWSGHFEANTKNWVKQPVRRYFKIFNLVTWLMDDPTKKGIGESLFWRCRGEISIEAVLVGYLSYHPSQNCCRSYTHKPL